MNSWGIPKWLEDEVRARDKTCVYCGIKLQDSDCCKQKGINKHTVADVVKRALRSK